MKFRIPTSSAALLFLAPLAISLAHGAVIQTNLGTGDGTNPGGEFVIHGNLLNSNLTSATSTGTFYRQGDGYDVDLSRLSDGQLGSLGSQGLGGDGRYTVMPNVAVIQFNLNGAYDIASIRTYASWDSGRSGQSYTIRYATASDPSTFIAFFSLTPFNNTDADFPSTTELDFDDEEYTRIDDSLSTTLVTLTSDSRVLMSDVVALQFVFNGYQNGGTAYREFQVTAVPEPSLPTLGLLAGGLALVRRRRQ